MFAKEQRFYLDFEGSNYANNTHLAEFKREKCDNGLYICDHCGSCCSHNMLSRRLATLESAGGNIHDKVQIKTTAQAFSAKCVLIDKIPQTCKNFEVWGILSIFAM